MKASGSSARTINWPANSLPAFAYSEPKDVIASRATALSAPLVQRDIDYGFLVHESNAVMGRYISTR